MPEIDPPRGYSASRGVRQGLYQTRPPQADDANEEHVESYEAWHARISVLTLAVMERRAGAVKAGLHAKGQGGAAWPSDEQAAAVKKNERPRRAKVTHA